MVETLIIHAGAPKTATTYIQRGLQANRTLLEAQGVYLPQSGRLELEPNAVCHHHLGWALINPERYEGPRDPWAQLARELEGVEAPVVVLSSETFSRVASKGDGADLVEEAAREICDSVTIVYFVRNQLSLMNSLYGQRVKSFRLVEDFDYHTRIYRGRRLFDYAELLGPWSSSPAVTLHAVPFTGDRASDPLATLLATSGIEAQLDALVNESDDVNASLGPVGIEAVRLLGAFLRGAFPDFDSEELAAKKLYRLASSRAQQNGWCDESFWGWNPTTAAETVEFFAASNDRFAHDVWGSGWPLDMPVERATTSVRLLDQPPPTVEKACRFVFSLAERFARLRDGRPGS